MKFLLLLLLFTTIPWHVQAQPIAIQIVHNGGRNPRPVFRAARASFDEIGIKLRLRSIRRMRIPFAPAPGLAMYLSFAPAFQRFKDRRFVTVVLARPSYPLLRGGTARICSDYAVATWDRDIEASSWILAHEIGHALGAQHDRERSLMYPYISPEHRQIGDAGVIEIEHCTVRGRRSDYGAMQQCGEVGVAETVHE